MVYLPEVIRLNNFTPYAFHLLPPSNTLCIFCLGLSGVKAYKNANLLRKLSDINQRPNEKCA